MGEPKRKPETNEKPATQFGQQLVEYLEEMPADERAVIDDLAARDKRNGNKPTPDA